MIILSSEQKAIIFLRTCSLRNNNEWRWKVDGFENCLNMWQLSARLRCPCCWYRRRRHGPRRDQVRQEQVEQRAGAQEQEHLLHPEASVRWVLLSAVLITCAMCMSASNNMYNVWFYNAVIRILMTWGDESREVTRALCTCKYCHCTLYVTCD